MRRLFPTPRPSTRSSLSRTSFPKSLLCVGRSSLPSRGCSWSSPAFPGLPPPPVFASAVLRVTSFVPPPATEPKRSFWSRIFTRKFLFVSILAHLLFGLGATDPIVQSDHAKRKLTFQGGPPGTNPSKHALEHKVSMAQKKKTGGAPPQAKRIATTGLSAIALPEMPSACRPRLTSRPGWRRAWEVPASARASASETGWAAEWEAAEDGGGNFSFFGFRGSGGGGLIGSMYDLKQNRARKPTKIGEGGAQTPLYTEEVKKIAKSGFHEGGLSGFFKAPQVLSSSQFLIPVMDANEGPKAYGVEKDVQPGRWVAIYRGRVSPPKSGTYRFVGAADDVILVRVGGRLVLDGSLVASSEFQPDGVYHLDYGANHARGGFVKGKAVHCDAGQFYDMEVLIGERPGGLFYVVLLVEEEGVEYKKDGSGNPILPLFRTAAAKLPSGTVLPPMTDPDGPIWKIQAAGTGSLLDSLKR